MSSPFDFVKTINQTKENLLESGSPVSDYVAFIINKALSFRPDAVAAVQLINERHWLDEDQQYAFLLGTVPSSKAYHAWMKEEKPHPDLELVKRFFGYNTQRATEALGLLKPDDLERIRQCTGGQKQGK